MLPQRLLGAGDHVVLLVAPYHQQGVHGSQAPHGSLLRRTGDEPPLHLARRLAEGAAQPLVEREADAVLRRNEVGEPLAHAGERSLDGADLAAQHSPRVESRQAREKALRLPDVALHMSEAHLALAEQELLDRQIDLAQLGLHDECRLLELRGARGALLGALYGGKAEERDGGDAEHAQKRHPRQQHEPQAQRYA